MAIFSGAVTGVLGFTGVQGFIIYLLCQFLVSFMLTVKMNFSVETCALLAPHGLPGHQHGHDLAPSLTLVISVRVDFPFGATGILTNNLGGGALSFMLMWTLFYDICHLYQ